MNRDLPHLAARVFNTPLLVHRDKLDTILAVVGPRIVGVAGVEASVELPKPDARGPSDAQRLPGGGYMVGEGIAVYPVIGTLVRRGSWLDATSGLKSYAQIGADIEAILADARVRGLMLEIDSPGGEAGGCFDLVDRIAASAEAADKPVWAHANELAASAGYAIASVGERLWLAKTAEVGSIGVVAAHVDMSEADAAEGIKWTYIYAGENKVLGNPHEPLSKSAREVIQADVNSLYELFVDLVSKNRGIAAQKVRDTKASIYRGRAAVKAGLADDVGTLGQALAAMAETLEEPTAGLARAVGGAKGAGMTRRAEIVRAEANRAEDDEDAKGKAAKSDDDEDAKAADDEDAKGKAKGGKAKGAGKAKDDEDAKAADDDEDAKGSKAAAVERARCAELSGVAKQAARLGVGFDLDAAIAKGTSPSAARKAVLDAAAARDEASPIVATGPQGHRDAGLSRDQVKAAFRRGHKRR